MNEDNKTDQRRARRKKWRQENREKVRAQKRRWYSRHREEILQKNKEDERRKEYQKEWRKQHPEYSSEWLDRNPDKREYKNTRTREWFEAHPDYAKQHKKRKYDEDPHFLLKVRLHNRVNCALRRANTKKSDPTVELIGCSWMKLKEHIESLFLPGMSWMNRRLWHIDHIRPCSTFNLTDPEQQKECFNYANLRPLWAQDNLRRKKR